MLNELVKSLDSKRAAERAVAAIFYRDRMVRGHDSLTVEDAPQAERALELLGKSTLQLMQDVALFEQLKETVAKVRTNADIRAERDGVEDEQRTLSQEHEILSKQLEEVKLRLRRASGLILKCLDEPQKKSALQQAARDIVAKRPDLFSATDLAFPKD